MHDLDQEVARWSLPVFVVGATVAFPVRVARRGVRDVM